MSQYTSTLLDAIEGVGEGGRRRAVFAWLRRYGPAEAVGTLCAVVAAQTFAILDRSDYAVAGAFFGEIIGFYAVILLRDLRKARRRGGPPPRVVLARVATEFGPAEFIDWPVRALAMYLAMLVLPPALGALVGKVVADAVFWTIATAGYLRARRRKAAPVQETESA
jgi:hypothetical protein